MKIVVPTDFSQCSKIAVQFAIAFARQIQAEIILLHVLPRLGATIGRVSSTSIKEELIHSAENEFSQLTAEINPNELSISCQIAYGAGVENVINPFIETHNVDLIIMGSKGASGLKKILMGSNTVRVVNNCSLPVIIVPEHAVITPITSLVYASDLKNLTQEVKSLLPFAKLLQSTIKIIHMPPLHYFEHFQTEKLVHDLRAATDYQQIEIELIKGEDLMSSIEQYTAVSHGEILTMFTHHISFPEQIFSQSLTREIASHNKIPLLIINNR